MNIATFANELKKAVTYDDTEYAKVLLTRFKDEFNHLCIGIFYINNIKLPMSRGMWNTFQPFIKSTEDLRNFTDFYFKPKPLPEKNIKLPEFTKDTKITSILSTPSPFYEAFIDQAKRDIQEEIDKSILYKLQLEKLSEMRIELPPIAKLNTTS